MGNEQIEREVSLLSVLKYWLWLSEAQNVSVNSKAKLIARYHDAQSVFYAPDRELQTLAGISAAEASVLEKRDLSRAEEIITACASQDIGMLTMQDAAYPKRLKQVFAPPVVLYVKGKLPVLDDEAAIAVIGTRHATSYGLRMGRNIAYEIAKCGGVVISGLTSGVDAAAAKGALMAGGVCVGVLGTAFDDETGALASQVAQSGALITEHAPGTKPLKSFFRDRNRISSGISVGVVVVEAPQRSGTRLFVSEAAEQGKEIFALPGNAADENCAGTNAILKEGAKLVTAGGEVMEEFVTLFPQKITIQSKIELPPDEIAVEKPKIDTPVVKKDIDNKKTTGYIDLKEQLSQLNAEQLQIVTAIGGSSLHIDDIIQSTGLSTSKVLAQLTFLEIKGYIHRESGRRIALNTAKK